MGRPPSVAYTAATILAAVLAVAGIWLPWVQKRPVGYVNGQPYYTSEWVPGLETGFQGPDAFAVLLAVVVIFVAGVAHKSDWLSDGVLIVAGAILVWWSGTILRDYLTVERYSVAPGLYLCITSGVLLVLLGAGAGLRRYRIPTPETKSKGSVETPNR